MPFHLSASRKDQESGNAEQIVEEIKNLEKISEFYVERRMNASIKTLIEGKGVDDIL